MENTNLSQNSRVLNQVQGVITLLNGEVLDPGEFDRMLLLNCHYINHVVVTGNDMPFPIALVFPDSKLFSQPDYIVTPLEGCFCPRNANEMGRCLTGCMRLVNNELNKEPDRIHRAVVINDETLFEDGKLIITDDEIVKKYERLIHEIYHGKRQFNSDMYYINAKDTANIQ